MSNKIIVLHSGGLDSSVCLLLAHKEEAQVISLGIDYGQRLRIELEYAKKLCERYNIPRKVITVSWDKPQRNIPQDRSIDLIRNSISSAFLPARNVVFLSLACAEAGGLGANEVWIGINSIDYSGYPDCRPDFLKSFQNMINLAMLNSIVINAPLINLSKPEIAKKANYLGLKKDETWSCYQPDLSFDPPKPCGRCDACILNNYAWNNIS